MFIAVLRVHLTPPRIRERSGHSRDLVHIIALWILLPSRSFALHLYPFAISLLLDLCPLLGNLSINELYPLGLCLVDSIELVNQANEGNRCVCGVSLYLRFLSVFIAVLRVHLTPPRIRERSGHSRG